MTLAADYLTRALQAEAKAALATGTYRIQMQALAAQWRDLARQAQLLTEFEEGLERERQDAAKADEIPSAERPASPARSGHAGKAG